MAEAFLASDECYRQLLCNEQSTSTMVGNSGSTPEGGNNVPLSGPIVQRELENPIENPSNSTPESEGGTSEGQYVRAFYFASRGRNCDRDSSARDFCLRCDLAGLFGEECDTGTLVHQIFTPSSPGHYPSAFGRCMELVNSCPLASGTKFSTWAISIHKQRSADGLGDLSHIHLIHSCKTYSESHKLCRCGPIRGWEPLMFDIKRRYFLEVSKRHVETLLLYLSKEG